MPYVLQKIIVPENDKVKSMKILETKWEYISVTYGCIRFIDSCRFLSESLNKLVKNLDIDDLNILKKEFPDKWQCLNTKLAYP